MAEFDVIVIGAGPGGYVCAIRCGQLGLKVACVEGRGALGGTCLNVGCIPSKALLHTSELVAEAGKSFAEFGIKIPSLTIDWAKMQDHKARTVEANTRGIEFLFKKNKVEWLKGWGEIVAPGRVRVGEIVHHARDIVIATGSEPAALPGIEADEERIVTSTGALALKAVPKRLAVIGAGVIGLELGSVFRRLGAEVTVIEYLDGITPGVDLEVAKAFQRLLQRQGLRFLLGTAVETVEKGETLRLRWTRRKDGTPGDGEADVVLVATGRRPYTKGLGLEAAGLRPDGKGMLTHDGHGATGVPGIWVVGDVTSGPMLAHKAEDEGMAVAERIAGRAGHVNYGVIPGVIYTAPEVAWVGETEEQLKDRGRAYKAGRFQFLANGRAKANLATDGFVKILADAATDRILGIHIIGPHASDLIAEAAVAMEFHSSAEDLARSSHAHPTLAEAIKEAALGVDRRAIHV
jgi:dihydrolipoamide dehydrogenase